ncbi:FAD-dependent monooxygenase [Psychromarinibacter sp. C21-152]|uniref:FAD-dependent monooxygenase n=1 Tax=Psychromarinibacter sediminicola TaxID=3033385 RepID=A0AAE3T8G6_9RHOB|nr:FAD-dependent monooxygenase [Psychromarinibacter sediminicola]MDF0600683.1 FAD-dependent monooxygenase [Psychromarinibacter sediminicola]
MDAILIGGGLNGPALALALAQAGLEVTLVERLAPELRTDPDFDGRSYALSHAPAQLLRAIGIWDAVAGHAQPIHKIQVTDGRAGEGAAPFFLLFDGAEIEEWPPGYVVEDRYLRRAYQDALDAEPRITQITGVDVTGHAVDDGGVTATLSDGRALTAQMVVGCDGVTSRTAARAGIGRMSWSYGQTSFSCAISHEKPHNGIAHQFFMPPGPLAILPLPGNRSSIVWTETDSAARRIAELDDDAYLALLRPRVGDFLGDIALAGRRFHYPVPLSIAHRFAAPRVALVGDAAHRVHPLAGQGLNAGLKDVGALAEVLVEAHRRGEDIGRLDVLQRYERWRRFDVATLAWMTDGVNRLFSNDNPLLRLGRDIGLGVINGLPGLRRGLMREAAGVTGDVPKLLRGRAL